MSVCSNCDMPMRPPNGCGNPLCDMPDKPNVRSEMAFFRNEENQEVCIGVQPSDSFRDRFQIIVRKRNGARNLLLTDVEMWALRDLIMKAMPEDARPDCITKDNHHGPRF